MIYSIKQLADISGVSNRTLRYYDEIGLLKPAYYGDNGYRYYGEKELLLLQQILFLRALDFSLCDIQKVLTAEDFDTLKSLENHRLQLLNKMSHLNTLVNTIDKTILHLRGDIKMKEVDLFLAFKHPMQLEISDYVKKEMGAAGEKIVTDCQEKIKQLTPEDFHRMEEESRVFSYNMKVFIEKGLSPSSEELQTLMEDYYNSRIKPFSSPSPEELIKLVEIDIAHPKTKAKYDDVHPQFGEYYLEAIKVFAGQKLKK